MKKILLLAMLMAAGLIACQNNGISEPNDEFGVQGGVALKLDGVEWKCEKTRAEYDSLVKAIYLEGYKEISNGHDSINVASIVMTIPFDSKIGVPQKIGGGAYGVMFPYMMVSSIIKDVPFRIGSWDSRTQDQISEAIITINKLTKDEVSGIFSGLLWDLNRPGSTSGGKFGTLKVTEGRFRVPRIRR